LTPLGVVRTRTYGLESICCQEETLTASFWAWPSAHARASPLTDCLISLDGGIVTWHLCAPDYHIHTNMVYDFDLGHGHLHMQESCTTVVILLASERARGAV